MDVFLFATYRLDTDEEEEAEEFYAWIWLQGKDNKFLQKQIFDEFNYHTIVSKNSLYFINSTSAFYFMLSSKRKVDT